MVEHAVEPWRWAARRLGGRRGRERGFASDPQAVLIEIGIVTEIGSIGEAFDNDPDPDPDFDLEGSIVLHCKT
jgi:hypothetical protein